MSLSEIVLAQVPPGGLDEDKQHESNVIGNVLARPALLDEPELQSLRVEDFYTSRGQALWGFLCDRGPQAEELAVVETGEFLAKTGRDGLGTAYVMELVDHSYNDWRNSAVRVRFNAVARRTRDSALELFKRAHRPRHDDTIETLANQANVLLGQLGNAGARTVPMLEELADEFLTDLDCTIKEGSAAIPTGFVAIDKIMGGGCHPGDFVVVGARPSTGKTSLARNICRNVASQGHGVVFFSLEVKSKQFTRDLVSGESGLPAQLLRDGRLKQDQIDRVRDAADWLSRDPRGTNLGVVDYAYGIEEIVSIARGQARLHNVKLVVVDYLQLVEGTNPRAEPRHQVSQVSRKLKLLAKKHNVTVLALAQLNRKADEDPDRRPRMSDLKESGAIEQDADVIALLHRPDIAARRGGKKKGWKPKRRDEDESPRLPKGIAELIIDKNRNGPIGEAYLRFHGPSMTFHTHELEEDEYE